nr:hypothetical protein [Tanacetum cinerariifolium]
MHSMGKTVTELHAMLKLHEQTLPPKEVAPTLHAIKAGRIEKNQKKKSPKAAKGNQGKGKAKMATHLCFAMKDLEEAAYILGIKIYRDRSKRLISLCQSAYIEKILKRFYMENSKRGTIQMQEKLKFSKSQGASTPAEIWRMQNIPYASVVGLIMYAVRCTHPDVAFAQSITSRFQHNPGDTHWTAVKNILKYLRNTKDMFLVYGGDMKRELRVSSYTHAGYLTDADDMKSQTGYVFVLNRGDVDWKITKQSIFVTSYTNAEYVADFDASKEAVWICKFISGLGVVPTIKEPINIYYDNTRTIEIAKYHEVTKGARHFHVKIYYLQETIEMGDVMIEKVNTYDNLADPFTKALVSPKHFELTEKIGMILASSLMNIQTDKRTEFVNQTLKSYYKDVRISYQTSVTCTPQQNDFIERRNQIFMEAAHTMLIFSKDPLYLWAEAPTNDSEDLGKLKLKADIVPVAAAPRPVDLTGTPLSTSIDQDAPS